jgi:ABC-type phosphate/phosphonate transport system substrate-binding protein
MGNPYLNKRLHLLIKALFLLLLSFCIFCREIPAGGDDKSILKIGFSSRAFVNVPMEDIKIAIQVLSEKVARKTVGPADSRIYGTEAEIENALKSKTLELVATTPDEFIHLRGRTPMEPVMVTVSGKTPELELLLMARKESGINRFRDLKNRGIALPAETSQFGAIYHTWLENMAMREGAGAAAAFFSSIKDTKGASQSLMSVFFRKADACIISRNAFEVANELNPQLSRELKVIASIGKLIGGIVVFRQDLPEERKQKVRKALSTLHEDPDGKQMFVLFQLTRLEEFRPEYLKATEALLAEHSALRQKSVNRRR